MRNASPQRTRAGTETANAGNAFVGVSLRGARLTTQNGSPPAQKTRSLRRKPLIRALIVLLVLTALRAAIPSAVRWGAHSFARFASRPSEWKPTPESDHLKQPLAQFPRVATGGAAKYEGQELKEVDSKMKITNDKVNALVGDLEARLDKLRVLPGSKRGSLRS